MSLPQDPFILLSYINTKLRDEYRSLDDLCNGLEIDRSQLETTLAAVDFTYNEERNQFL